MFKLRTRESRCNMKNMLLISLQNTGVPPSRTTDGLHNSLTPVWTAKPLWFHVRPLELGVSKPEPNVLSRPDHTSEHGRSLFLFFFWALAMISMGETVGVSRWRQRAAGQRGGLRQAEAFPIHRWKMCQTEDWGRKEGRLEAGRKEVSEDRGQRPCFMLS